MTTTELQTLAKPNKEQIHSAIDGPGPVKELWGQRFGRLVVVGLLPTRDAAGRCRWLCLCDCGAIVDTNSNLLNRGHVSSCGCLRKESSKKNMIANRRTAVVHGHARKVAPKERTYRTWQRMMSRCYCQTDKSYKRYGGRGILVCDKWWEYTNFREWAVSNGYQDTLTIDRIDNDGPYSPENCRWITKSENSKKRWVDHDGR